MRLRVVVVMVGLLLPAAPAAAAEATQPDAAATASDAEALPTGVLVDRADLLALKQDWSGAEAAYLVALERDPDQAPAWRGLGYVRRKLGHGPEAVEAYEHALALAPEDPDTLLGLGETYVMVGRTPDAAALMERLRAVAPRHAATLDYVIRNGKAP